MASDEKHLIRSIRFKPEAWAELDRLSDEEDRSINSIVNRAVLQYAADDLKNKIQKTKAAQDIQAGTVVAPSSGGGLVFQMTVEFRLPAMDWADERAYEIFFDLLADLQVRNDTVGGVYGQIHHFASMEYDERLAHIRLPGSWAVHKSSPLGVEGGSGFYFNELPSPQYGTSTDLQDVANESLAKGRNQVDVASSVDDSIV